MPGLLLALVGADPARAAARRLGRPAAAGRPAQRLARFRPRAGRDPAAADPVQRRPHPGRAAHQPHRRSRWSSLPRLRPLSADRRRAAMGGLRPRRLCDLLLGPVAQASRPADLPADLGHRRSVVLLAVAFGSISFVTYATSFWVPPYVDAAFLWRRDSDPARYHRRHDARRRRSASSSAGAAAVSAATGVILGGYHLRPVAAARSARPDLRQHALGGPADPARRLHAHDRQPRPPSTGSTRSPTCSPRPGSARRWRRCRTSCCRACGRPPARPISSARPWSAWRSAPISPARCRMLTGSLRDRHRRALLSCRRSPCSASGSASRHIAELEATKVERARAAGEPI